MTNLKSLLIDFVFGNFLIAFCALGMIFTTFLLNGLPLIITPFSIFLLFATYLVYNFHSLSFRIEYSDFNVFINSLKRIQLSFFEKTMYLISTVIVVTSIFYMNPRVFPYLIPLAMVAGAYSIPLIRRNGKKIRLLEVYLMKTPVVALVWALVTLIIPLEEQNIEIHTSLIFLQFLSRTLFIFALCIPFEIRDMDVDKKKNVLTIPVVIGKKRTMIGGTIIILLELIIHHFMSGIAFYSMLALDLSSLIALLLIILQDKKASPFYYKFLIDGTMIARFIFLFIAMQLT